MRPLRLTLQAFGSYPDEVTVDVARLARHGVFSISGPTGAGKSTIFDALVYALYDDLPGFRVDGNVRSQYAADDVETRVRLEFEVHGERWAVDRTPAQVVRRRRGEGTGVERKSSVVLERLRGDGTPIAGPGMTRKSAVAERVEELVGLSKGQFEQVVLIPQGRFEEVLKAETKARAVLLRRLFPVDVYGRVTAALKDMVGERERAFRDASSALDCLVSRLGEALKAALGAAGDADGPGPDSACEVFDVDAMTQHMATLSSARGSLDRTVRRARAEHERAVRALDEGRRSAAAWDRWRADASLAAAFDREEEADVAESAALERARRVGHLDVVLRTWEEATVRRGSLKPELQRLAASVVTRGEESGQSVVPEDLTDAARAGRAAERFRLQAEALAAETERFEALASVRDALDARTAETGRRRRTLERDAEALQNERRALAALEVEIEALSLVSSGAAVASAAVDLLEAEHGVSLRREAAAAELERAALRRADAAGAAAEAQARLDRVRTAWRSGLAGRLAALLVGGEPCPTCGAREHPSPAVRLPEAPDDAALQVAESAYEEAQRALQEAEQRHGAALGALDALSDARPIEVVTSELADRRAESAACRDAAGRLAGTRATLSERQEALTAGTQAWEAGMLRLELDVAVLAGEQKAHEAARLDYEQRHGGWQPPGDRARALSALARDLDRIAKLARELEEVEASEQRCRALLAPLVDELGAGDPAGLAQWRSDPDELAERAAALEARAQARAEVRRRIADYEASGGRSARPDVDALAEAAESTRTRHDEAVGRRAVMEENARYFAEGPALLETANKEVAAARRALEQARTIADRCAGSGGGASQTRLSLENWVLADYLRHVLRQANERLAVMTGGRFALQLSDGVTDGRKAWGLDLSVFDACTGQVRPATTLSGGETFMAALALALGLADVVSGGSNREVGALFVDEGFGSLDPHSLDSVVEVLRSLEDGGRLVGVVSHVEAVQEALPSGITVCPTPSGSSAEVHYPPE